MPTKSDSQSMQSIRLKERFNRWFPAIIVGFVILALLGGWFVYGTHIEPGTETEEEVVASWDERSDLSHFAEVTRPSSVFEQNETLTNQRMYFTELSPELNSEYEYHYTASDGGEVDIELSAELVLMSLDSNEQPFWEQTELLARQQFEAVEPGESVTIPASINIGDIEDELEQIEEDLGASVGDTKVAIRFDTRTSGTVNGDSVRNSHQDELVVDPDGATFGVEGTGDVAESHEKTVLSEFDVEHGLLRSLGSLLLLGGSLTGLGIALVVKTREEFKPTESQKATLAHYRQRNEYDDWISVGSIPVGTLAGEGIKVESLEDLVDIAIDTNNRVIEDTNSDRFIVVADDWYFTEPELPLAFDHDPLVDSAEGESGKSAKINGMRLFAGRNGSGNGAEKEESVDAEE